MKVVDYALSALAVATDVAQHPRHRAGVNYPTVGFEAREPVQTASVTALPQPPVWARNDIQIIYPRAVVASNATPDATKPMLGLYSSDQVTTETTTFENGIDSSKWIVDTRGYGGSIYNPYMRQMDPDNVSVEDGLLKLKVPGGQTYDAKSTVGLKSAQIMSTKMFSVGSIEMTVQMSDVEGTCQCGFLYGSDANEVDMEFLTRTNVSWAVVQPLGQGQPIQQEDLNVTTKLTDSFHTYKVVRTESKAYFLFDGQLVNSFDKMIPTDPVQVMVAHWTDANPGWTGGPPAQDAIMSVKKIVVEYVGATKTFTTSTAGPSATGAANPSSSGKGAAPRSYGSTAGSLWALAALCFYLA